MRFPKNETIFAAYDKSELRKAKILRIASSDLFWLDVILLAGTDLDWMLSTSMAIGVQRQTRMNSILIVFAGINHYLQERGLLSRLREPATAEDAMWPAIKDILESMGEIMDVLTEGGFQKVTPVFVLSPGYEHLPNGLKFVYALIALLLKGYNAIVMILFVTFGAEIFTKDQQYCTLEKYKISDWMNS